MMEVGQSVVGARVARGQLEKYLGGLQGTFRVSQLLQQLRPPQEESFSPIGGIGPQRLWKGARRKNGTVFQVGVLHLVEIPLPRGIKRPRLRFSRKRQGKEVENSLRRGTVLLSRPAEQPGILGPERARRQQG